MPLDIPGLPGAPEGNLAVVERTDYRVVVDYVPPERRSLLSEHDRTGLRVSHFATCPNADAHRKRRKEGSS
jgi:hypothetical protein